MNKMKGQLDQTSVRHPGKMSQNKVGSVGAGKGLRGEPVMKTKGNSRDSVMQSMRMSGKRLGGQKD